MRGMNVSEAIGVHQDYLELSEGISGEKNLIVLLSTPNQELLTFDTISGAKSIQDLEKENLPVR